MASKLEGVEAFPLQWPDGWPRTKRPTRSNFKVTSFGHVRDRVIHEIRLMNGSNVVISTNIPLRLDGLPYASFKGGLQDPGVAVYWFDKTARARRCMACDRWDRVRDNMRALEKSIDALRGLKRWGSTEIVARAFEGFKALPPTGKDWRAIFGVPAGHNPPMDDIKKQYHKLARLAHSDHGGNEAEMVRLNEAMSAAKAELSA
jgi:hypothetical protein